MAAIRKQFQLDKLMLKNDTASDFYLGSCQCNRNALPLLCMRLVLFLGCVSMLLSSMLLPERIVDIAHWPIYMTQWGLIMITVTYGLATAVSAVAYFKGPIDATFGLPWVVRLFWGSYCIAVPLAFFITAFYYLLVRPTISEAFEINEVLDVFTHGINSVVMFILMMTSNLSIYLVQFVYPMALMLVYMIFSIIYYYAGGTNQNGDRWIYPVLDWSEPSTAVGSVFLALVMIISIYILVFFMTLLRDLLTRRFRHTTLLITDL
ncbi:protein rolling stone-like [Ostrinia nubilalis]|uniref:protein rolling stone-like n=1 Tax=Ostrinia nubilalis TaxID=29057 RepID=UPI0030825908